jgi:hypothetical protein
MNTPGFKLYTIYVCGFLFSILTIGIYWASVENNIFQGIKEMLALRWGVVMFLDFYIGASVLGVWIGVLEKSVYQGFIWLTLIYILGNLATLVYLSRRVLVSEKFSDIFIPTKK